MSIYNDEISDVLDVGSCILELLRRKGYLWEILDEMLGDDAYAGLKETYKDYWEEREEME